MNGNPANDYPDSSCIHDLFSGVAEKTPDTVALVQGDRELTYGELDRRSNQLAHWLRNQGVRIGDRVGLSVDRSPEMLIGMLGILKSGGAYVPLDPLYPSSRIQFMLQDASLQHLVTQESYRNRFSSILGGVVCLDSDMELLESQESAAVGMVLDSGALAYVMYTSGSTGEPKGVCIPHRAIARLVFGNDYARFGSDRVFLQLASISFDASTFEIWGALLWGAQLVLAPPSLPDFEQLGELLRAHRVTTIWLTSTLFNEVVDYDPQLLSSVQEILTGGEALSVHHIDRARRALGPGVQLINGYGPTESTTFATCYRIPPSGEWDTGRVPIGRPIANTQVVVLDEAGSLVPLGAAGELCIGGDGLALGYWNRDALTREKFVRNPYSEDAQSKLYRTGDRCRWRADGNLEYLGRLDAQIKLRGYRIEPGEIELMLARHPSVSQSAVILREDRPGHKRLVGYCLPSEGAHPCPEELMSFLRERLPGYMVPSALVVLESFPLTSNGKLDREALPPPESKAGRDRETSPRTASEQQLALIWREVLGVEVVSRHDHFFDLGGNSLLAMRMLSRIARQMRIHLTPRAVFESPSLSELADRIATTRQGGSEAERQLRTIRSVPRTHPLPLSLAQRRMWLLDQSIPNRETYNVSFAIRFQGSVDNQALCESLQAIVERHESFWTRYLEMDGVPQQCVVPGVKIEVPMVDLANLDAQEREQQLLAIASDVASEPFDLTQTPLCSARCIRLGANECVMFWTIHHIACDGWSMEILLKEWEQVYDAVLRGQCPSLPAATPEVADYAVHEQEWLTGDRLQEQWMYWKSQLDGVTANQEWPMGRRGMVPASHRGKWVPVSLGTDLHCRFKELCQREGITLFMGLLSAFQILLSRLSGQRDMVVGSPVAGRAHMETENMVGFFVNTLALRTNLEGNLSYRDALRRTRETVLGAFSHQELPFDKLVEKLQPPRANGASPFFQTMIVLQNAHSNRRRWPGASVSVEAIPNGTAKLDLILNLEEGEECIRGNLEYNSEIFDEATARRMMSSYESILWEMVHDPQNSIANGDLGSELTRPQSALPTSKEREAEGEATRPLTPLEQQLVSIWREVLGVADVSVHDNFFDIGGNSLLAMRVFAKVSKLLGRSVPLAALFQHGTIRRLATFLEHGDFQPRQVRMLNLQCEGSGRPLFVMPAMSGELLHFRHVFHALGNEFPIIGVQPCAEGGITNDFREMARRLTEAIQARDPDGPYRLTGYSYGGMMAFEVASQLVAAGKRVEHLLVIDTGPGNAETGAAWRDLGRTLSHVARKLPGWILGELRDFNVGLFIREMGRRSKRLLHLLLMKKRQTLELHDVMQVDGYSDIELQLAKAAFQSFCNYRPERYSGRMTLLRAKIPPLLADCSADFGWSAYVDDLEVIEVPGNHGNIMKPPYAESLAERLKGCLARAES